MEEFDIDKEIAADGENADGENADDENADGENADGENAPDESVSDEDASKARMEVYDWIQCFVTAFICGVLIFVFVGRTIGVDGNSMMNTLRDKDRVIMHNLFYTPKNGDIIVFKSGNEELFHDVPLVKRIIATAGQTIDIDFDTGDVFIDGEPEPIYEPYLDVVTRNREDFRGPITIPDGFVFVMGDNRNSSKDSRNNDVGLVDTRYILGRVFFLLIPGENDKSPRDWSRIGVIR